MIYVDVFGQTGQSRGFVKVSKNDKNLASNTETKTKKYSGLSRLIFFKTVKKRNQEKNLALLIFRL
jgi:hypothetical protein